MVSSFFLHKYIFTGQRNDIEFISCFLQILQSLSSNPIDIPACLDYHVLCENMDSSGG